MAKVEKVFVSVEVQTDTLKLDMSHVKFIEEVPLP